MTSWTVVQEASGTNASASTLAVTFTSNVSSGNKILVFSATNGVTTNTVKDGSSNSWTSLGSVQDGSFGAGANASIWALDVPVGDVGTKPTITATYANGCGSSMIIQEVSGLVAGSTAAAICDGTPASLTGATATTGSPSYSSTVSGEYLVCLYADDGNNNTVSQASGWTLDAVSQNNSGNSDCCLQYKSSTGGSETDGWTGANTTGWALLEVAFKAPDTIYQDASTPSFSATVGGTNLSSGQTSTGTAFTQTSTSFSPPAGSLVVLAVSASYGSSGQSYGSLGVTVADSSSNSYTAGVTQNINSSGFAGVGIFYNYYASAPGSITVTATLGTAEETANGYCLDIYPLVLTGCASSQSGAATAKSNNLGAAAAQDISITPTTTGSWVVVVDGSDMSSFTASNVTTLASVAASSGDGEVNSFAVGADKSGVTASTPVTVGWSSATTGFGGAIAALEILPAGSGGAGSPTITTTSLPIAYAGAAYSVTLAASGGTTPYTWSVSSGSLPAWASLNSSTGAITGTPTSGSTIATFTVEVTDHASNTATQVLTLDVNPDGKLSTSAIPGRAQPGNFIPGQLAQTGTTASAGRAQATAAALAPSVTASASPSAGLAPGTATALTPSVTVAASAGLASATATALAASVTASGTASAGLASGTATARAPSVTASGTASTGLAQATATALAPSVTASGTPTAGLAQATAAALTPSVTASGAASAGLAQGTATSLAPSVSASGTGSAGLAQATAAARTPTVLTGSVANAGLATATAAALAPSLSISNTVTAGLASATAAALAPSVSASGTASAGLATATAAALAPSLSISNTVTAGVASATAVALNATISASDTDTAGLATATATALTPTVTASGSPTAGLAQATAAALAADGHGGLTESGAFRIFLPGGAVNRHGSVAVIVLTAPRVTLAAHAGPYTFTGSFAVAVPKPVTGLTAFVYHSIPAVTVPAPQTSLTAHVAHVFTGTFIVVLGTRRSVTRPQLPIRPTAQGRATSAVRRPGAGSSGVGRGA